MPRYPAESTLSDPQLRELIGPACYVELALAAGRVWNANSLETLLRRYLDRDGTTSESVRWDGPDELSNLCRQMLTNRVPAEATALRMDLALGDGSPRVARWRSHALWEVLRKAPVEQSLLLNALGGVRGKQRDILYGKVGRRKDLGNLRRPADYDFFLETARHGGLDGLLVLTVHAREARQQGVYLTDWQAGHLALKMFPKVIVAVPNLYIRWKHLALLYAQRVWCSPDPKDSIAWTKIDLQMLTELVMCRSTKARRRGISLPPDDLVSEPAGWNEMLARGV